MTDETRDPTEGQNAEGPLSDEQLDEVSGGRNAHVGSPPPSSPPPPPPSTGSGG